MQQHPLLHYFAIAGNFGAEPGSEPIVPPSALNKDRLRGPESKGLDTLH